MSQEEVKEYHESPMCKVAPFMYLLSALGVCYGLTTGDAWVFQKMMIGLGVINGFYIGILVSALFIWVCRRDSIVIRDNIWITFTNVTYLVSTASIAYLVGAYGDQLTVEDKSHLGVMAGAQLAYVLWQDWPR